MERWGQELYGDPCRNCGWDWSTPAQAAVAYVAGVPQEYRRLLQGRDATRRHPDLGWSAADYVCHVADNLRIWAERLAGAALASAVDVPGYDEAALGAARNYNAIPAEATLWSLANAARDWQQAVTLAGKREVVLRHAQRGEQRVADVVANNAHDAHHHGWDIRRSLTSGAAETSDPVLAVRDREPRDRGPLLRLVRLVNDSDDYPARLPRDLGAFVYDPSAAGAWVSTTADGDVVGHVALHRHSTPAVLDLASEALDRRPDELVVVARLLVHPDYRRRGIGAALLARATAAARRSGAAVILDVATRYAAAIALYERAGWRRIGTVTADIGLGTPFHEHVFTAPAD